MSIEGRINVDVLFHDKDGTASLKVVSLQDSQEYTTGKVAVVTGTCGTTPLPLVLQPSPFRDAAGALVSFSSVSRAVVKCNVGSITFHRYQEFSIGDSAGLSGSLVPAGHVCIFALDNSDLAPLASSSPAVMSNAGTASYTIVMYGT